MAAGPTNASRMMGNVSIFVLATGFLDTFPLYSRCWMNA